MKKIKIEQSYEKISWPFKVLLSFIVICVLLTLGVFVASGAKRALFTMEPWEPTMMTRAHVNSATYETHRQAPSDYLITYTYVVNGKSYNDYDTIASKDYTQQQTIKVVYKRSDPSVNRLDLSTDNAFTFIGAAIVLIALFAGTLLLSAYYFFNWRPRNLQYLKQGCLVIGSVGIAIMLLSYL